MPVRGGYRLPDQHRIEHGTRHPCGHWCRRGRRRDGFLVVGLDHGDKLASMLGAIVAVLALGLTVYQLAAGSHSQSAPAGSSSKYNVHVTRSWFVKIGDGE